ncbi:protein ORF30 [Lake sturgeon herpesvirus]|nr:protein ORF30 [Lake sturgeon herpesvirus]
MGLFKTIFYFAVAWIVLGGGVYTTVKFTPDRCEGMSSRVYFHVRTLLVLNTCLVSLGIVVGVARYFTLSLMSLRQNLRTQAQAYHTRAGRGYKQNEPKDDDEEGGCNNNKKKQTPLRGGASVKPIPSLFWQLFCLLFLLLTTVNGGILKSLTSNLQDLRPCYFCPFFWALFLIYCVYFFLMLVFVLVSCNKAIPPSERYYVNRTFV